MGFGNDVRVYSHDYWNLDTTATNVWLDFLLPYGIIVPMEVQRDATIQQIKEELWEEAGKHPLYGNLRDAAFYVFICVNGMAESEELLEETRTISEVKPFANVLKVVERKGEEKERLLDAQISALIGKGLHEFDSLQSAEVNSFRSRMRSLAWDRVASWEGVEIRENRSASLSFGTTLRKRMKTISSWAVEDDLELKVISISNLNCETGIEIGVEVGVFHGTHSLCSPANTSQLPWEQLINDPVAFDLEVCHLPRMARLCLGVYRTGKGTQKGRTVKQSKIPLCWASMGVFDFRGFLSTGPTCLPLRQYTMADDTTSTLLNSLGASSTCYIPDPTGPQIVIEFRRYHTERVVSFPPEDIVLEAGSTGSVLAHKTNPTNQQFFEQVAKTQAQDLHEQEKKQLWLLREEVLTTRPAMLPLLVHCIEWNHHYEISQMANLVHRWPSTLPMERALELLDCSCADAGVRAVALRSLETVSDEDLELFLLQLLQALKHEGQLFCPLVEFLVNRAWKTQRIGHFLFWHLRSEMHDPFYWVHFGLVLEAFCRGLSTDNLKSFLKQLEALKKLRTLGSAVQQQKDKERAKSTMKTILSIPRSQEIFRGWICPLDPSWIADGVKVDGCRVMDSKMRPMWINLKGERGGSFLFKDGDDLRQDMLTLQMLRIMDKLWKDEGLNLQMVPYGCISTDYRVGLIEVVTKAETIANIQKEKGAFSATSAFKKGSLFAWLRDRNPEEERLNQAVQRFTLSCAGYCVATYVLGVADRHSDNIMVRENGQLFHIDFGHILGHFKEKLGIRRERVPFVLTHDFVHVIIRGQKMAHKTPEFQYFKNCCEKAFMVLRRHGVFILSLFAMMISTGLPELSSEKDLDYIRDTLVLSLSEEEALVRFQSKFDEALKNSWKTSLNWASHNIAKNNRA